MSSHSNDVTRVRSHACQPQIEIRHINNWENWGGFCVLGNRKPCPCFPSVPGEAVGGKGYLYIMCTVGIIAHLSKLQQHLADVMRCRTNAQQESFKLISSRQTCLQQCFNEYSSSRFSLHHLSAMQGQAELELAKNSFPLWCEHLLFGSLWRIFSTLIHKAQPTKEHMKENMEELKKMFFSATEGRFSLWVKPYLIYVKANIICVAGFGVVFFRLPYSWLTTLKPNNAFLYSLRHMLLKMSFIKTFSAAAKNCFISIIFCGCLNSVKELTPVLC